MKLYILGIADKRPILYPLLHILDLLGGALLVTDDGAYRRLLTERGRMGGIGNIFVYSGADVSNKELRRNEIDPAGFEHTVYALLDDTAVPESGFTIYARQDGSPFADPHPLDDRDESQTFKVVHVGFEAPKEKGTSYIPINDALLKELHTVENLCQLKATKNQKLISVLAPLFAQCLGRDEKSVRKLLGYKGN